MKKISIRFAIISLFLALAVALLAIVYISQYSFIEKMSQKSASAQFNIVSEKLNEKLKNQETHNIVYMDIYSSNLKGKKVTDVLNNQHHYLNMYSTFLSGIKNTYSVYLGDTSNRFFEVINLSDNTNLRNQYNAVNSDKWLTISVDNNTSYRTLSLYDKNLVLSSQSIRKNSYKPKERPWFKLGMRANGNIIKSDPYMFSSLSTKGVTYTKKVSSEIVLSIDILVQDMNKMLISRDFVDKIDSFIVNPNKKVVASSTTKDKILKKILKDTELNNIKHDYVTKTFQSTKYAYSIKKINSNFLVSIANLSAIANDYRQDFMKSVLISLLLSIVLLPIFWYLTSLLIAPILKLSKENKRIVQNRYKDIRKIKSNISEISQLSNSMYKMASSIKNHNIQLERKVEERTKELKKLSITDRLTGLYNRMKIDESIEQELKRQNRYGNAFGIIIVDIDHFKSVNDIYGHQAGDDVLKEFAKILKNGVRKTDVVGRWGGEEFLIICIEIKLADLIKLAEKLRAEVENTSFSHVNKITASFGVSLRQDNEKTEQFINRADKALYKAKNSGRNRVEAF